MFPQGCHNIPLINQLQVTMVKGEKRWHMGDSDGKGECIMAKGREQWIYIYIYIYDTKQKKKLK